MSPIETRLEAIKASLAAAVAPRIVTREWVPITQLQDAVLEAGQYTLISRGERDYQNVNGREAMDGIHSLALIARVKLAEDSTGLQVEALELDMVEEVKAWLRSLSPGPLCCLLCNGFDQSGQLETPYGWVTFDLEFLCDGEEA